MSYKPFWLSRWWHSPCLPTCARRGLWRYLSLPPSQGEQSGKTKTKLNLNFLCFVFPTITDSGNLSLVLWHGKTAFCTYRKEEWMNECLTTPQHKNSLPCPLFNTPSLFIIHHSLPCPLFNTLFPVHYSTPFPVHYSTPFPVHYSTLPSLFIIQHSLPCPLFNTPFTVHYSTLPSLSIIQYSLP